MYAPVPNGQGGYDRIPINNQHDFYAYLDSYFNSDDAFIQKFINQFKTGAGSLSNWFNSWLSENQAIKDIQSGANPNDVLGNYIQSGLTPSQNMTDYIANAQAGYNTKQAQDFSNYQMNNSLLSAGLQLQALGLSPSGVIQTGGAIANGVGAANVVRPNGASLKQQRDMQMFQSKMSLAKSLIGAAGSMASSGIYGAAIGAVKHSAQVVASQAANSGLKALNSMRPEVFKQLMIDEARRKSNSPTFALGPDDGF